MIQISDHAEGCIVPVRAQPGARRSGIVGEHGGALKIAVTAPPDQGKANRALIEVVCGALNLKRSQVEIVGGNASRDKRILIRGLSSAQLRSALCES
jgi:uncharacterized protein (TIGR00251 family)